MGTGAAAWFLTDSHARGATLAGRVLELADRTVTPLDLDVRARGVRVRIPLTPEDDGWTTDHLATAREVSALAAELGLAADPAGLQDVQLTFDVLDQAAVSPFWETVLGYARVGDEDLVDPARRHPPIWFQDLGTEGPRPLRNRLHLDAVTPRPVAEAVLATVQARGARVVPHGFYATVADAEGNEVDLLELEDWPEQPWQAPGTEDWRLVFAALACYPTTAAGEAAGLVTAAAALADDAGLPLNVDVRPGLVTVATAKDAWETDGRYEALAARVQLAARGLGLVSDPALARFVQVGIDAVDVPAARAFWRAALGYEQDPRTGVTDLVDPRQLNTTVFLQDLDVSETARRAQRNRIHVDVFLPDDLLHERLEAALAAGGTVVHDAGPIWWTVADPEGNEVDLTTAAGREEHWRQAHPG
ncbi:VOC family protein [Ornithinimicrobium avium]|uniref:VOC family protein n=1 Tax=Ornithinimicrobium avium TaxID=2283195 RepID=A0A345NSF3_9MICO|nr:VOC family protein [Ornithinimicrobium avium]